MGMSHRNAKATEGRESCPCDSGDEVKMELSRDRDWQSHGNAGTLEWTYHKPADEMVAR